MELVIQDTIDMKCFSWILHEMGSNPPLFPFSIYSSRNGEAALFDLGIVFLKQHPPQIIQCSIQKVLFFVAVFFTFLEGRTYIACFSTFACALELFILQPSFTFLQDSESLLKRYWSQMWEGGFPELRTRAVVLTENFLLYTLL